MLILNIIAPFAVFRPFTTGAFRSTLPFISYTAAYGLLLNIAGIDMREYNDNEIMTQIKTGLPEIDMAIGKLKEPDKHSIYQQLHNYPVGASAKEYAAGTFGNKYNISPVRREFLSDFDSIICIKNNKELEEKIQEGLKKGTAYKNEGRNRFGQLFLGDNSFLIDKIIILDSTIPAYWYEKIEDENIPEILNGLCRMPVYIDRKDNTKTINQLVLPTKDKSKEIPETAWITIRY